MFKVLERLTLILHCCILQYK